MARCRGALDQRAHVAFGDRGLGEHRRDPSSDDQIHHEFDAAQTGFALGADSLNPEDIEPEPLTEISERVMRGDEDANLRRQGCHDGFDIPLERGETGKVPFGVGPERGRRFGLQLAQRCNRMRQRLAPEPGIHPQVRIGQSCSANPGLRQQVPERDDRTDGRQPLQDSLHLRFQVQAIPEDQVRLGQCGHVGPGGAVEVRIDPLPHQAGHPGMLADDLAQGLRNLGNRGHDRQSGVRVRGCRHGEQDGERGKDDPAKQYSGSTLEV